MATETETARYDRTCNECGRLYRTASRNQGGPFHFMIVTIYSQPDDRMQIVGHWRSGDWIVGQTLYLRRRDGRYIPITDAEMLPAINQVCENRGQRSLLVPNNKHLQPRGCISAFPEGITEDLITGHTEGT
ncbi:hypothetical protein GCM10029978_011700 [Actinoallomurus acanthiterrae]